MASTMTVPARPREGDARISAILVTALFLVAMVAAWALKSGVESRTLAASSSDGNVSLAYPVGWAKSAVLTKDTLIDLRDTRPSTTLPSRFRVESKSVSSDASLGDLAALAAVSRGRALREYRELGTSETTVSGQRALQVTYGYVTDPPAGSGPATLPIVVHGTDTLVLFNGKLYTFSALNQASDAAGATSQDVFDRILSSVRLK